jgi:hypothetical protein
MPETDTSVWAGTNLETQIFVVCPEDYIVLPPKDVYIILVVFAAVQYTIIGFQELRTGFQEFKISAVENSGVGKL